MRFNESNFAFTPNQGGQTEFLHDWEHKFVSLVGGLRSGKTHAGVIKLILCLLHNNFTDGKFRNKYINALIVAQSFATLRDAVVHETLLPLLEKFNLSVTLKQQKQQIVLDDLSTKNSNQQTLIYLRSAVNAPDLKGFEVGCFLLDECGSYPDNWNIPQKDAILQSIGRLAAPSAKKLQGYFCGSPEGTSSRWYKMFFREDNIECKAYRASTRDNPYVQEAVKTNELIYSEQLRKAYIDGIFVDISGSNAYCNFTEKNIDDNLKLDNSLPLHVCCDFGAGNTYVVGQETEELLFSTHEIHGPKMQTKDAMVELKKLIDEYGPFPELHFFGDAMGNAASGESDFSSYIIMQNYAHNWGIPSIVKTLGRNPLVKNRINAANNNFQDINNKIHWKCHSRCTGLINDFKNVSWNLEAKKLIKTPELSHFSDAETYRIHYLRQIVREQEPMNYGRFNV